MTSVRTMRLVCSGFWADVRLTQVHGRWVASADTPDGPSMGLGWFAIDALDAALEPFDGFVVMSRSPHADAASPGVASMIRTGPEPVAKLESTRYASTPAEQASVARPNGATGGVPRVNASRAAGPVRRTRFEGVMNQPKYIFIVGMSRTGTTLLRNILNCSDEVGMGGESRFLVTPRTLSMHRERGFRDELRAVGDISTESGAKSVVDHIFTVQANNFWGKLANGADRDKFLRNVLASDRTERVLLDLALEFHAQGKPIRGEKTPGHIDAVPEMLEWFPNAKIIHMIRDPRASFVSKLHKKGDRSAMLAASQQKAGLLYELYASLRWAERWLWVIRLHRRYRGQFSDRYRLLRFEDLVTDPRTSINEVCSFVGIGFKEQMLNQSVTNSSFSHGNRAGFDAQAIDRWRSMLSPAVQKWFRLWCGTSLRKFGYRP